jgi:hypothetical protein
MQRPLVPSCWRPANPQVRVWDAASLRCLATLVGHTGAVRALAATDSLVFSGSDDTTIRVRSLRCNQAPLQPTVAMQARIARQRCKRQRCKRCGQCLGAALAGGGAVLLMHRSSH